MITDPTHTATHGQDIGLRFCQAASLDRAERWHSDTPWSLSDWMTALTGEVGEAAFARVCFGIWLARRTSQPARRSARLGSGG